MAAVRCWVGSEVEIGWRGRARRRKPEENPYRQRELLHAAPSALWRDDCARTRAAHR
jgi:hypothetical protein